MVGFLHPTGQPPATSKDHFCDSSRITYIKLPDVMSSVIQLMSDVLVDARWCSIPTGKHMLFRTENSIMSTMPTTQSTYYILARETLHWGGFLSMCEETVRCLFLSEKEEQEPTGRSTLLLSLLVSIFFSNVGTHRFYDVLGILWSFQLVCLSKLIFMLCS